jgi:TetR/AcrR family transcriptional regulator, tetracycline repressor protein
VTVEEKSRLTRQAVVGQALALADEEGMEGVTIRRLADQLGVTPMALYWHVKNKDELLTAMADQLLAEVGPTGDPDETWQVQLRAMIAALIGVMRKHRCAAALLSTANRVQAESFLRATDGSLGLLRRAGFSLQEGFVIACNMLHDVIGLVDRQPGGCKAGMTAEQSAEWHRQERLEMEALPIDQYPNIVSYAAAEQMDVESYFAFGLDLIMAGIETLASARSSS